MSTLSELGPDRSSVCYTLVENGKIVTSVCLMSESVPRGAQTTNQWRSDTVDLLSIIVNF